MRFVCKNSGRTILNLIFCISCFSSLPYFKAAEAILSLFYLKQVLKEDAVVYGHVSSLIVLCHDLAKHFKHMSTSH